MTPAQIADKHCKLLSEKYGPDGAELIGTALATLGLGVLVAGLDRADEVCADITAMVKETIKYAKKSESIEPQQNIGLN